MDLSLFWINRAPFMMTFVAWAMLAVIPLMVWGIRLAHSRRDYRWHRNVQTALYAAIVGTVLAFEVDVRLNGWQQWALPSPYYSTYLFPVLYFHLCFAVSATVLWTVTVLGAWRRFDRPPRPSRYGSRHRILGMATAATTVVTAITGWVFFYMAFVA